MVGLDNGRDCARGGFGHGVATALHGALQLRLGEPPRADLRWDDHLRCGGRGCAIGAQPGGARRSTSRALDRARSGKACPRATTRWVETGCLPSFARWSGYGSITAPSINPGIDVMGQKPSFQLACAAGFDALKMYRLVLKKYLPASLRRSNSLCHSFRSSAETSFFRATKSRIPCDSPLL